METSSASAGADLALFLKSLAEDGRAVVSSEPLTNETEEALSVLRQMDEYARSELALEPPQFSANAALWAARLLYQLCQFTVCRNLGEEQIAAACDLACSEPRGSQADWSADLTLRHLTKLFELARHLSHADPLVQRMKQIASAWPLSSVGIPGLKDLDLGSFMGHPALRRLYADRVFAASDVSRLGDARLDDLLRADLGIHHELAPALAGKLFPTTHDPH